jgi:hypothetical protein
MGVIRALLIDLAVLAVMVVAFIVAMSILIPAAPWDVADGIATDSDWRVDLIGIATAFLGADVWRRLFTRQKA